MTIAKKIIIHKDIESTWKVLGTEFANVHIWASPLKHSEGTGSAFNGSTCGERSCDISGMGKIREKLTEFSNEQYALKYLVLEGMPSVVKKATNSWKLTSLDANTTEVNMQMDFALKGFMGMLMQPMMKMMMGKMGATIMKDLKYYLENGEPSQAKRKALNK